jgi:hypothetical protein
MVLLDHIAADPARGSAFNPIAAIDQQGDLEPLRWRDTPSGALRHGKPSPSALKPSSGETMKAIAYLSGSGALLGSGALGC